MTLEKMNNYRQKNETGSSTVLCQAQKGIQMVSNDLKAESTQENTDKFFSISLSDICKDWSRGKSTREETQEEMEPYQREKHSV